METSHPRLVFFGLTVTFGIHSSSEYKPLRFISPQVTCRLHCQTYSSVSPSPVKVEPSLLRVDNSLGPTNSMMIYCTACHGRNCYSQSNQVTYSKYRSNTGPNRTWCFVTTAIQKRRGIFRDNLEITNFKVAGITTIWLISG